MKQDRLQALMSRLSIVRTLSLAEAMELLNVSESTARRMFPNWNIPARPSEPMAEFVVLIKLQLLILLNSVQK